MDTNKFANNGKNKGIAFILKKYRAEAFTMCKSCGEKFFSDDDLSAHRKEMWAKGEDHSGSYQEGEANGTNGIKFNGTHYCSKCGLCK